MTVPQPVEPPDHDQVLPAGERLVHRRVLAGQPDQAANSVRIPLRVHAADPGLAGVGGEQGDQDPHQGGLARPVRAEQALHGPARTLMSTPASTLVSPKDLLMPSTSIMAPRTRGISPSGTRPASRRSPSTRCSRRLTPHSPATWSPTGSAPAKD